MFDFELFIDVAVAFLFVSRRILSSAMLSRVHQFVVTLMLYIVPIHCICSALLPFFCLESYCYFVGWARNMESKYIVFAVVWLYCRFLNFRNPLRSRFGYI